MRFRLRYLQHDLELNEGTFAVGRNASCQLSLDDPLVSRRHALFEVTPAGVTVEDLNSRNGVRVNGVRLRSPKLLSANDRIRLGRDELVLLVDSESDSQVPERPTAAQQICERCGHEHVADLLICPACGVTPGNAPAVVVDAS